MLATSTTRPTQYGEIVGTNNKTKVYKDKHGSVLKLEESKAVFVEALVESSIIIISTIWPEANNTAERIPLKNFIKESLRRSRTCYSTFQVALYYLILLKESKTSSSVSNENNKIISCGRRAFLTSLIIASKYLQDRNYTIKAWSAITGLSTTEIRNHELEFLKLVDWKVHVQPSVYNRWSSILLSSASEDGKIWTNKVKYLGSECIVIDNNNNINSSNNHINNNLLCTITTVEDSKYLQQKDSGASAYPTPTMSDHDDYDLDQSDDQQCYYGGIKRKAVPQEEDNNKSKRSRK